VEEYRMKDYIVDVKTPLNFTVHTTREYWQKLLVKHPELEGKLKDVQNTLEKPLEIRRSRRDELIFLFYSEIEKYWLCVVTRRNEFDGFIVTAYITDKIKEGEIIWQR
jgi:hypothetical protein